jgi:peptidoglycan/xylan/chitin deacetylase (PgdA/CDA1 family)
MQNVTSTLSHFGEPRFSYKPMRKRSSFSWPKGRGLAVYFALNLEHYSPDGGLTENLVEGGESPDILNVSWREYGNRIGAWRLLDAFQEAGLPATVLLNSDVCRYFPELVAECRSRGHEIGAHGRSNSESQRHMDEAAESEMIREATEVIRSVAGTPPVGWLSPWLAETPLTPDLLQEAGYKYVLDWCVDDQPFWMKTRKDGILSLPYSVEINDSVAIIGRHVGAEEFGDMIIDHVDEMVEQSRSAPLALGIALHGYIIGQPYRLRHFRRALAHLANLSQDLVWVASAGEIADHFSLNQPFKVD